MANGRFTFSTRFSALSALAALCVFEFAAAASPAPAGIIIESTAQATYDDAGVSRTISSNSVQVQVDELLDVAAASLDAGPINVGPGSAVLSFIVSNNGNGPESFSLEVVTSIAGNGFDTALDSIAIDTNGNSVFDAGIDTVLPAPSSTPALAAGASQAVFVILTVPDGTASGAQSSVNLIARAATGTGTAGTLFADTGESGANAIVGLSGGSAFAAGQMISNASTVTLVKWASVADIFGGTAAVADSTITYAIEALVSGSAAISGLVISDQIPAGTRYLEGSLTLDGAPLSDAAGDDSGEASPEEIAVNLGSVPGGSSSTVTFKVLIEQ